MCLKPVITAGYPAVTGLSWISPPFLLYTTMNPAGSQMSIKLDCILYWHAVTTILHIFYCGGCGKRAVLQSAFLHNILFFSYQLRTYIFKWYEIRWFFEKNTHIFGLPKFRSPSLFPPNYFSRILLNYDFIDLLSI